MLDIFINICSVSVLTFIGQIKLECVVTRKLMILPFFLSIAQNRHGLLAVPAYKDFDSFDYKGIAKVKNEDNLWGLIDLKGNLINPCQFNSIRRVFYPGFYEVRKDTLYGLINDEGKTLFPTEYKDFNYIYFKSSGESMKSYGEHMISYNAKVSDISEIFICSKSFEPGRKYGKPNLWRFNVSAQQFTHVGEISLSGSGNELTYWGDNIVQIHKRGGAYIFDSTFKLIHNLGYDEIVFFDKHGHLHIKKGTYTTEVYLADKSFQVLSDDYKKIEICKNGMYLVYNYRYGYLDTKGQLIIPVKYQEALPFEEDNRALIKQGEKWGVIDQYGAEIIIPIFERIERSNNGFKVFFDEKKVYDVDRNGKCTSKKVKQYNELVKAFYKD
jgi:hypothetical protein